MTPLLSVRGLVKHFRGVAATDGLDFDVRAGEVHAVIGPNGAGKTTFINQLAGELAPDAGAIRFDDHEITHLPVHERARAGIARSYQITSVFDDFSVLENVMLAVQARSGHSFRFWAPASADAALRAPAIEAIREVGLGAEIDAPVGTLAHGARRQLELAVVLAMRPRLMLLDEPMAGMSPRESEEMVRLLKSLKGGAAIVLIEHDVDAVFALADRVTVLVYGRAIASGTPADVRRNPEVLKAYLGDAEDAH